MQFLIPFIFLLAFSSCDAQVQENQALPGDSATMRKSTPLPADTTGNSYAWTNSYNYLQSIESRINTPEGYIRIPAVARSFAHWLRRVPLKPGRPSVMLHNGIEKGNQNAHHAIINIDVGARDLQQCADAVMRLRAEFLFAANQHEDIHFKFTSGHEARYDKWKQGYRAKVSGNSVSWQKTAPSDNSWASFRKYMDLVFTYAGTASLSKELKSVPIQEMQAGDLFIHGGFPGHAVLVMDMAQDSQTGQKVFLLAQSYMPAQEMHILRNPSNPDISPWYPLNFDGDLVTPEWTFSKSDLKRFE